MGKTGNSSRNVYELVRSFRGKRVMILGDIILDQYIRGSVERISPEAPVPVVAMRTENFHLGGAGNVAANIHALGGTPILVGVVGNDASGERVLQEMERMKLPTGGVLIDMGRPTVTKTRIIAGHQQVCRVDRETVLPMTVELFKKVVLFLRNHLAEVDALLVSDYGKGIVEKKLLSAILPVAQQAGRVVTIDPKFQDFSNYRPATLLTPNRKEASAGAGVEIRDDRTLKQAGEALLQKTGAENILITLGEEGMALFQAGGSFRKIPTLSREVYDVTGAGDTVAAVMTLALCAGIDAEPAALMANHAAGVAVSRLGTATVSDEDLAMSMTRNGVTCL